VHQVGDQPRLYTTMHDQSIIKIENFSYQKRLGRPNRRWENNIKKDLYKGYYTETGRIICFILGWSNWFLGTW